MDSRGSRVGIAAGLFLLSGFSALLYQVIWQRILGIFSGVHLYSITMIVSAFMAGLGFGSLFGGRLADRLSRRASIIAFAACELLIGLFALISPWLYYDVAYLRLGFLVRYPALLPAAHVLLLLVPTILMGASLPLLSRGLVVGVDRAARIIGRLYALNTLGAGLGALVTVWYLIGAFGFVGAIRLGSLLNFAAAAGALLLVRAPQSEPTPASLPPPSPAEPLAPSPIGIGTWAAIYAASGFVALSLEILWFRVLDVFIRSSPYTFGHILGTFLVFLAIGARVGAAVVERSRRPDLVFFFGQWGITASAALALAPLLYLPADSGPLANLHAFWSRDERLEMYRLLEAFGGGVPWPLPEVVIRAAQLFLFLPLGLLAVPTFLMGFTYAFIQRAVQTDLRQVGWRVGLVQAANIVGSILGSLLTGTVLLQWLGTPAMLRLLIAAGSLYGVAGVLRSPAKRRALGGAYIAGVSLLLAATIPGRDGFWARFHGTSTDRIVVSEDASSVVVLQRMQARRVVMRINGTGHSLLPHWAGHILLGCAPALLHQDAREILIIGMGTGGTALGGILVPTVERLDLYEIARPERDVLELYDDRWFEAPLLQHLLADPRVRFTASDGRLALRTEQRTYDVIEADALEPSMAYSGNLYSKEFFELCLSRLKPGGLFLTYVPTERTRRTAIAAFPHVLELQLPGLPTLILGSREPFTYDPQRALSRLASEPVRRTLALDRSEGPGVSQFLEYFFNHATATVISSPGSERPPGDDDLNHDLFPRDEYDKSYRPD